MNTLREALQEYVDLRRGLGYKMHDEGLLLPRFVSFMEEHCAEHISVRLAVEWAQGAPVQPAEWARRLCFVRGFARHRSATDSRTEIPPIGLLPHRSTRARPHLYTEDEIRRLLDAALELPVAWPSNAAAPVGVPRPDRPTQCDGHAPVRSSESQARRRRPQAGGPDDSWRQVRPVAVGADPSVLPARSWPITSTDARSSSATRPPPICSSRVVALASTAVMSIEPSTRCHGPQACVRWVRARGRGCTTSGIASPFRR